MILYMKIMIAGIADDPVKQEIIILVFPETGVLKKLPQKSDISVA